jgi:hypothetical protein
MPLRMKPRLASKYALRTPIVMLTSSTPDPLVRIDETVYRYGAATFHRFTFVSVICLVLRYQPPGGSAEPESWAEPTAAPLASYTVETTAGEVREVA